MLSLQDSFAVLCSADAVSDLDTGEIRFVATPSYHGSNTALPETWLSVVMFFSLHPFKEGKGENESGSSKTTK